jgi:3-phosphoshikimate 1-carboxyvinyltransferase
VDTYRDHRMAMSFALPGLRVRGIQINDPACVAKTFPGYFQVLESLAR